MKRMYRFIILFSCFLVSFVSCSDSKSDMNKFVSDLMNKMTLEEKIGQLNLQVAGNIITGDPQDTSVVDEIKKGNIGGIFNLKGVESIRAMQEVAVTDSRLGIPLLVGMDVIHGYETVFPIPLALSCSWDSLAVEEVARISAKEASADGINWVFSPMVDVCLDSRWGRVAEGSGEDPYMNSVMGRAMVRGYQGDLTRNDNVMSCVKHFALYGAVEAGRDYNTVDMSRLRMYNQYFPPYKACVEAGAGSVMTSFNIVEGVPATANKWLIDDVLRKEWGFNGFVVTDYASINEMMKHRVAYDKKDASCRAMVAGTDMDMCSRGYVETLKDLIHEGEITEDDIDIACRRVLEAKYKLGLFADPFKYCDTTRRYTDICTMEHRERARAIAAETFVLLKNDNKTLPLKRKGKIALIGPLADTKSNMTGMWSVASNPDNYSSLKESMQRALDGKATLLYAQGCNILADSLSQASAEFGKHIARVNSVEAKRQALRVAGEADVIVCAMGECAEMTGESSSRSDLSLPDEQMSLLKDLAKVGKPIVLLNFSGRATVMKWEAEHIPAIMNVWFGGSEMGDALCDVLFGEVSPSGKLTMSMPQSVGQLPLYYNHASTGRPIEEGERFRKYASGYLDTSNDALYPFGYGLSYTNFEYYDLIVSKNNLHTRGDSLFVSVRVANEGDMTATEVVQLYISADCFSFVRPIKELRQFVRVEIPAGEERNVVFRLSASDFMAYGNLGTCGIMPLYQPGTYRVMVGPNSRDLSTIFIQLN